ncbi:MAG: redoxin domain-containing protein [Bacteroidetes bacterium]|nr:redoxin domain-containing protein [Bacteroidota bacterium]
MFYSYKKTISLFILVALTQLSFAAAPGTNIKIKIKGVKDTFCLLANHFGDKQYIQDTLKVDASGKMSITKKDGKYDGGIYLVVVPNKKYFEFIMDETQNFTIETDTADLVGKMVIKGSNENMLFYDYLNFINQKQKEVEPLKKELDKHKANKDSATALQAQINEIDKQVSDYKKNFNEKNPNTFAGKLLKAMTDPKIPETPILSNGRKDSTFAYRYYKAHFFDNIDFTDDRLVRSPVYHGKLKQYFETMVLQHPDSINKEADFLLEKTKNSKELFKYTAHYITYTYEISKIMGMDAVFVHMVEKVYQPGLAYWVDSTSRAKMVTRAITLKPLLIGKRTPNLILADTNMKLINLSDVKAKYTVLIFWDYDCGHCQKEVPKLAEFYNKVKDKGVEVYSVSTEYDAEKWKKFIREHKLNWINVWDPYHQTNFKATYDITSTPQIYILNDKKEIIAKKINAEQAETMITNYLKPKP